MIQTKIMFLIQHRFLKNACAVAIATILLVSAIDPPEVHAQQSNSANSVLGVQTATAPTAESIRARAQRFKDYRELLADRDPNIRFAALDEMLKSDDAVLRELAYDAGFSSAEPAMRAIVLRSRILTMKNFTLELQRPDNIPEEQWQKTISFFGGSHLNFSLTKPDLQTGNVDVGNGSGHIAGQEFTFAAYSMTGRLRLEDGAVMRGSITKSQGYTNMTAPAIVTVQ